MTTTWITRSLAAVMVSAAFAAVTVTAHHSFSMFEMDKDVEYAGVVTEWRWQNPHVHIVMEIKAGPNVPTGQAGTWDIEGGSINIMGRQGWTRSSYKPGDPIRLVGHPMRDGSKGISLFYAIRPDGTRLYHDIARPKS
jgi:Family of unknown function (DUF6152)